MPYGNVQFFLECNKPSLVCAVYLIQNTHTIIIYIQEVVSSVCKQNKLGF